MANANSSSDSTAEATSRMGNHDDNDNDDDDDVTTKDRSCSLDTWGVLQSLSGSRLRRSTALVLAPSLTITSKKNSDVTSLYLALLFYINNVGFRSFLEFGVAVFGTIITTSVAAVATSTCTATIMSRKQKLPK